jgi:hypothetical protein
MSNIIIPNESFQFDLIHLGQPSSIQGGAYFTKIYFSEKPLYIQTPKSYTKQGFVKNGKKIFLDLMFDNNEPTFIHWLESLEVKCHELIYEKGDDWFQERLEKTDIETAFTSPVKIYRSGKNYLVRTNVKINNVTNMPTIKIYNENEVPLQMEDITSEKQIITVLEIQGIRFTSRSFQIDIEMKQLMLLDDDMLFDKCVIHTTIPKINIKKDKISLSEEVKRINVDEEEKDEEEEEGDIDSDDEREMVQPMLILKEKEQNVELKDIVGKSIIEKEENIVNEKNIEKEEYIEKEENIEKELSEISDISDISLDIEENGAVMKLKKPEELYYEIYRLAKKKALKLKHQALLAFLEAKNIKKTYMLEDLEEDDSIMNELDFKHIEDILNYNMENE